MKNAFIAGEADQLLETADTPMTDPLDGNIELGDLEWWLEKWVEVIKGTTGTEQVADGPAAKELPQSLDFFAALCRRDLDAYDRLGQEIPSEIWRRAGTSDELYGRPGRTFVQYRGHPGRPFANCRAEVIPDAGFPPTTFEGIVVRKQDVRRVIVPVFREMIKARYRDGNITRLIAESWLVELLADPLPSTPDPETFDPLKLPDWRLEMAIAWIETRDPVAVREFWPEWREAADRPKNSGRSNSEHARGSSDAMTDSLRRGCLGSTGILVAHDRTTGPRIVIPDYRWLDISLIFVGDEVLAEDLKSGTHYRDISVALEGVLRLWPPYSDVDFAEVQCKRSLVALMSGTAERPWPLAVIFESLKASLPALNRNRFDKALKDAQLETGVNWSKPGRPRAINGRKRI